MTLKFDSAKDARHFLMMSGVNALRWPDAEIGGYLNVSHPHADTSSFHKRTPPATRADAVEFRVDAPTPLPAPAAPAPAPSAPARAKRHARLDAAFDQSWKQGETADQFHARTGSAAQAAEKLQAEQKLRTGGQDVYAEAYANSFKNGGRP